MDRRGSRGDKDHMEQGLERRDNISGQEGCMVESLEKSTGKPEEEVGKQRQATAEKLEEATEGALGESICHNILGAREVDKVAGELERKDNCFCCWADQGGETMNKSCVRGLWSVNKVSSLPSRRNQKCLTVELAARSYLSKAE